MHVIEAGFTVAAVVLLVMLGWAVFVFFSPYRECRWCRPSGLLGGSKPRRRRKRRCWRCKGTKLTRRLGAKHAHRVRLSLLQAWEERREGAKQ